MDNKIAKPFFKWAGGKTQLINEISKVLPSNITKSKFTYFEPFEKAVINDINEDLINTYKIIA